ncbi:MAG: hypothetical protein AAGF90_18670 [Pseudomonadota bacterium]
MIHLALILFAVIGTVFSGAWVVAVIELGVFDFPAILEATVCGYLLAIPPAILLAERIVGR